MLLSLRIVLVEVRGQMQLLRGSGDERRVFLLMVGLMRDEGVRQVGVGAL